mmetsp:Transcript_19900/g.45079  ORF Transcript_19900/g.45079 Transcript_19900/m.45079 type:complete len:95 (-) Transcript_19900:312-596(-)
MVMESAGPPNLQLPGPLAQRNVILKTAALEALKEASLVQAHLCGRKLPCWCCTWRRRRRRRLIGLRAAHGTRQEPLVVLGSDRTPPPREVRRGG